MSASGIVRCSTCRSRTTKSVSVALWVFGAYANRPPSAGSVPEYHQSHVGKQGEAEGNDQYDSLRKCQSSEHANRVPCRVRHRVHQGGGFS